MKTSFIKQGLITFFLLLSACDSFVEVDPPYTIDAENYFSAPEDYEKALIGAYDLMQTSYLDMWIGEIASDNSIAGGESVTDTEGLHQIDAMSHGGVNAELRSLFRYMYSGIARVNYLFEFKDNLEFDGKSQIMAQAAFLRAYYYFQLVKYFGDVPLILDKRLIIDDIGKEGRAPAAEVYAQIEKDLKEASSILPWTVSEKGRITKGAALALLGKTYLYQKDYDEAAETLQQVVDNGGYALFSSVEELFRVTNEGSRETVFDIEYVGAEGGGYGCFVCLEGFVAVGFHGIRGYKGPVYSDGNSYNLPTQDLVDAFDKEDARLEASILDIKAFEKERSEDIEYTEGVGGHTGYYNNKYIKRKDELGASDNDLTSPVDHKVIRYADVLLMAAEAYNLRATPNDARAVTFINQVRNRAGVTPIGSLSGAALTDAIFHERRLEFAGEGLRFFDLVRSGKAATEIENFQEGKNEIFPIPQAEIDLAGGGWTQNPGY